MAEPILAEREGAIATVIFERPQELDAMIKPMRRPLGERAAVPRPAMAGRLRPNSTSAA